MRVLLLCLAAGFTTLIDQSVLNVAVPALRDSLGAGTQEIQWLLAGYSLAFGLALVPGGLLLAALGPALGWRASLFINVPFGLVSGVYLTAAVGSERGAAARALLICVGMLAASAVCALLAARSPALSAPAAR
ncbi:hypothetical protein ACIA8K_18985 [Catenuloplanes sp. NPDC051500]|uniref:hypothetical protein n=1 Tax=Catenuloplanes sp. NPDC051500 TaxID=3363959 RepID=UPI0037B1FF75